MVAGAILPIAFHNNQLYFLFGKENPMEDSSKGWSDFGGGCENDESPFETALREGSEELTGFLGNKEELKKKIDKSGYYTITMDTYHSHLFLMEYDENLPVYYNHNHSFLWNRMNKHTLNNSRLFEKIEIKWFSVNELRTKQKLFRHFYKEMVQKIIKEIPNIKEYFGISTKSKTMNKRTRKLRGG